MSFYRFPKIFITIFGGIFLFLTLILHFGLLISLPALAQDALQCTPAVVNVNRDLMVVSGNDIYASDKIYTGSAASDPYIARSGLDMLFQSSASIVQRTGSDILFQNTSGNRLAGIYASIAGAPAAANNSRGFVVDGTIEAAKINTSDSSDNIGELCIQGSCITSWNTINTSAYGEVDTDTRCDASTSNCTQLCIGTSCVNSWAQVVSTGSGSGVTITNNELRIESGSNLVIQSGAAIKNSGLYQVCDATGSNCVGTGRGVSKIIAGSGITVAPASGDGDVTISSASRENILVRHSQSTTNPTCPVGWNPLWTGYSLALVSGASGYSAGIDLGSPASCLDSFNPMPIIECTSDSFCDYTTGGDYSMWLSAYSGVDIFPQTTNLTNYISRCVVCSAPATVLVRHTLNNAVPNCPNGWTSLWSGYSNYINSLSSGWSTNYVTGSTGSCLERFDAMPFIECEYGKCDYYSWGDFSFWLTSYTVDTAGISETTAQPNIGRCNVCVK